MYFPGERCSDCDPDWGDFDVGVVGACAVPCGAGGGFAERELRLPEDDPGLDADEVSPGGLGVGTRWMRGWESESDLSYFHHAHYKTHPRLAGREQETDPPPRRRKHGPEDRGSRWRSLDGERLGCHCRVQVSRVESRVSSNLRLDECGE